MQKIPLQNEELEAFLKDDGEPLDQQLPSMLRAMVLAAQERHPHDWDAYEFGSGNVNEAYPSLTVDCSCGVTFKVVY